MTDNERKKVFIEGYLKAYVDMREGIDRVLAAIENDLESESFLKMILSKPGERNAKS